MSIEVVRGTNQNLPQVTLWLISLQVRNLYRDSYLSATRLSARLRDPTLSMLFLFLRTTG